MAQQVKDPVLSLLWLWSRLWHRFDPWPKNFRMPRVQPETSRRWGDEGGGGGGGDELGILHQVKKLNLQLGASLELENARPGRASLVGSPQLERQFYAALPEPQRAAPQPSVRPEEGRPSALTCVCGEDHAGRREALEHGRFLPLLQLLP